MPDLGTVAQHRPLATRVLAFIDRWHWAWLTLAAPLLLFPSPGRSPALLVVPLLWGVAWVSSRRAVVPTPFNLSLLVMYSMVLVSLYATYDIQISLPKIAGLVLAIGVFQAVVRAGNRPRPWLVIFTAYLAIGLVIASVSLLGTVWPQKIILLSPVTARIPLLIRGLPGTPSGIHANQVAGALLWVIPPYLSLLILALRKPFDPPNMATAWRAAIMGSALAVGVLLLVGVLVLTQSRGAYLAFFLTIWAMVLLALRARWRWWFFVSTLALTSLLATTLPELYRQAASQWLLGPRPAVDRTLSLDNFYGRIEIWSRGVNGVQDFPFTGMGMDTFPEIVNELYPLLLVQTQEDLGHVHNEFLQIALDLGIAGLIAFISLYLLAFWMLHSIWTASTDQDNAPPRSLSPGWAEIRFVGAPLAARRVRRSLALGLGGGLLAHLLFGLTDATKLGAKPGVLFWMLLGLICSLHVQVGRWRRAGDLLDGA